MSKKVTKKVNNANRELMPKSKDRTGWVPAAGKKLTILTDKFQV